MDLVRFGSSSSSSSQLEHGLVKIVAAVALREALQQLLALLSLVRVEVVHHRQVEHKSVLGIVQACRGQREEAARAGKEVVLRASARAATVF